VSTADHALPRTAATNSQGRISLEFATDSDGRTFLGCQYASYPHHVCRALYQDVEAPNLATLYIQSCSGGLYEKDKHILSLIARRDAKVHLTTQASTIVHSMTHGCARQEMSILAEEGAYIEYLPDPQILFPRASLHSCIHVTMAADATVVVSEAFITNDLSSGEPPTLYDSEILIENYGREPIAMDRLCLSKEIFAQCRLGVLNTFTAQATLMIVTPSLAAAPIYKDIRALGSGFADVTFGVSLLPNAAGCIARILALDGAGLKRTMHALWTIVRGAKYGHAPSARRK
jgi:urease accessory protein